MTPTGPGDPTEPLDSIDSTDPTPARRLTWRRGLTAAFAVLALVAAGAFGMALAGGGSDSLLPAASSGSTADEDDDDPWDRMEKFRDRMHDRGPGMLGGRGEVLGHGLMGGGALHGTFVVPDPDGGYQTVVTQRGEVTAVSSTSLTVVSEDDHSQTYVLDDETLVMGGTEGVDSIEKGDQVRVTGLREGGSVRAVHVVDVSRIADLHPGWGPAPEPTTTTGTTTTTSTTADV